MLNIEYYADFTETLSDFNPVGVASSNFKVVVYLFINTEPQLPNKDCIIGLQEDLPVEMLFFDGTLEGLSTLVWHLRDNLLMNGFNQRINPDSNKQVLQDFTLPFW